MQLFIHVVAFRSNSNAQQNIPTVAKALLCKPSWQRTDEDLQVIFKAIENLMIFKKFPMLVKQELTRSLQYEAFEDGRIIIQQGNLTFNTASKHSNVRIAKKNCKTSTEEC